MEKKWNEKNSIIIVDAWLVFGIYARADLM